MLKIISECRELVKLYHINRGGPGFLRHSVVDYLEVNELILKLQPTYRKHHSTETAVLRVLSDILTAMDNQQVILLALLDLSAAFNCVDRDILLWRLQFWFGKYHTSPGASNPPPTTMGGRSPPPRI